MCGTKSVANRKLFSLSLCPTFRALPSLYSHCDRRSIGPRIAASKPEIECMFFRLFPNFKNIRKSLTFSCSLKM